MWKKLWESVVKPLLMYGYETWTLRNKAIDTLRKAIRGRDRRMMKI